MELQGKTIAVTGASGMIGVYICRSLLAAGAKVIGVVRNPDKAAFLAAEGVEFRKADLNDQASLAAAFQGCDAVVSNAAMYIASKFMSAWDAHVKANCDGTRHVYDACAEAGVKRVIQISTMGIYRWSMFRTLDEDSPQLKGEKKQGGPYRATKQMSEAIAWELSEKHGIALTALRPGMVYGARDANTLAPIYRALKVPYLPLPSVVMPVVYAGDVADAVVGALANDASIGQSYNVTGQPRQVSELVAAVGRATPKPRRVLPLPLPLGLRIDTSKAEREIGFRNTPLDQALKNVVAEDKLPRWLAA